MISASAATDGGSKTSTLLLLNSEGNDRLSGGEGLHWSVTGRPLGRWPVCVEHVWEEEEAGEKIVRGREESEGDRERRQ